MRSLRNFYVFRYFEVYWMSWSDKFLQVFYAFPKIIWQQDTAFARPCKPEIFSFDKWKSAQFIQKIAKALEKSQSMSHISKIAPENYKRVIMKN